MIKFNLLHPDDDFPENLEKDELDTIDEQPEPEVRDYPEPVSREDGLDETVLSELDEYKQSGPDIETFEDEDYEEDDEDEDYESSHHWALISGLSVVVLIAAVWIAFILGVLPSPLDRTVQSIKDKIVVMVSGEKLPEAAISEERIFEETTPEPAAMEETAGVKISETPSEAVSKFVPESIVKTVPEPEPEPEPVAEPDTVQESVATQAAILPPPISPGPEMPDLSRSEYEQLTMASARSQAFLENSIAFIRLFPKGLFISTLSCSPNELVLEAKAPNSDIFKVFTQEMKQSGLFSHFVYTPDNSADDTTPMALFRGDFKLEYDNSDNDLYNLDSKRFINYVSDIAGRENMELNDQRSFTVNSDLQKVKTTMHELGYYADVDRIQNFLSDLLSIPGTFSVEKIYLSRKSTDSFPDPIKLMLYVSLNERGE